MNAAPITAKREAHSPSGRVEPPYRVMLRAESEVAHASPDHNSLVPFFFPPPPPPPPPPPTRFFGVFFTPFRHQTQKDNGASTINSTCFTQVRASGEGADMCSGGGFVKAALTKGASPSDLRAAIFSKKLARADGGRYQNTFSPATSP